MEKYEITNFMLMQNMCEEFEFIFANYFALTPEYDK